MVDSIGPKKATVADTLRVPASPLHLAVSSFGLTDRGKVRDNNEDQFLIANLVKALQVQGTSLPIPKLQHSSDRGNLFIVADGMGGHAGGQRASALAIDSVETFVLEHIQWFAQLKGQGEDAVLTDFQQALAEANSRIIAEASERPQLKDMGTTLTLAYSLNDDLFVAHVGDSRCYLYRSGILYRLTKDHTLVEELVSRGLIKPEEAETHDMRHVITNAVGGPSDDVNVELHRVRLHISDGILLCSDGLTNMVSDDEISAVLRAEADPEPVCRQLVARANEAGGRDNITVIYVRYEPA